MRIKHGAVSLCALAAFIFSSACLAQTSTATSSSIISLSAGQNYDLNVSNVNVFGNSQNEIVNLSTGVKNVVVDINVESVSFPGGLSDYSFKADVSQVWVYKGSDLLATVPIQTDTDGTQLTFFNSGQGTFTNGSYNGSGTYNATLSADVVYIGSFEVSTTTPMTLSYQQSPVVALPYAPTNVIAAAGIESASVSFSAPSSNGGSSVTSYMVTASPGNKTATGTSSPITISGLSHGTAYTFKVSATNSAGQGASSVASNSVTPFFIQVCPAVVTAPAMPTAVSALAGDSSTVVSFAWSGGRCPQALNGFIVKASPGGQTATGSASPITISGLNNGTAYTFTVSSYNEYGTSAASSASASVMPVGPSASQIKLSLSAGWNLVGVGNQQTTSVEALFPDTSKVLSVWKWISNLSQWAFYTPSLSASELQAYASAKGYKVLDSIAGSEGFWINALQEQEVSVPFGTPYLAVDHRGSLLQGWNLVAVGEELTPVRFNNYLTAYTGAMPPSIGTDTATSVYQVNLTSLWAWDATLSNWYFYAPTLDRDQLLTDYISSKYFLDFSAKTKKLSPGIGFWVNKP